MGIWTFEGAMLIYGCYLAFVTRNYDRHLAEGQYIALAIYNMVLLAAVAALMVGMNVNVQAQILVQTITVTLGSCFATSIIFLPKTITILQNGDLVQNQQNATSYATSQQQSSGQTRPAQPGPSGSPLGKKSTKGGFSENPSRKKS